MRPIELFISYSHKDEEFVDVLKTHLSTLKRNGDINHWTDRRITAGTDLDLAINERLETASVVILMVSADFLSSAYCFDIEVKRAMERHEEGTVVVIPIITRPCDWKKTLFAKLNAIPTDGKAISNWTNRDDAYLNIVEKLRCTLDQHPLFQKEKNIQPSIDKNTINQTFTTFLSDTEIALSHRNVNQVTLQDVFVSPDLRIIDENYEKILKTINSDALAENNQHSLILGDEQAGKTTLAKRVYSSVLSRGKTPILLNGQELKKTKLEGVLTKAVREQYNNLTYQEYIDYPCKILLIDNFCQVQLSRAQLAELIDYSAVTFERIILFADEAFEFVANDISVFTDFQKYRILPFSNNKRAELTSKWLSIGTNESTHDTEYYEKLDELKLHLDQFVLRNGVPSKPIFLLSLLQSIETITPQRLELTTYGHCYQYLVYRSLERAQIKADSVDACFNYLTEFAGVLQNENGRFISSAKLEEFHCDYKKRYIGHSLDSIRNALIRSSILEEAENELHFKYRYLYYFFAGKYYADGIARGRFQKEIIERLIKNLHREESANILVFITHHSRSPWILDEIQYSLLELFEVETQATLSSDSLSYIKDFINGLPSLVLEQKDIQEERRQAYENMDECDAFEKKKAVEVESLDCDQLLARINRLFRAIELSGQIVRNKSGSLEIDTIQSLLRESYGASLRFLNFFLRTTDTFKNEVIQSLEWMLTRNPDINVKEVERRAQKVFLMLNYGIIYGTVIRIANSVGTREAMGICREIESEINTPALHLITVAMELRFEKKIDVKRLSKLYYDFHENPVAQRILKQIVIQHTYLHPVDYKKQQQLSQGLDIPFDTLKKIAYQKDIKMS